MANSNQTTKVYYKDDIDKAYNMGLDAAVVILEKTIGLSSSAQHHVVTEMKQMIIESKLKVALQ